MNIKSFFNGIEQLTNSLLIIGLAIAMREALYLSLYECKCLGMLGENDEIHNENELYNKFISKVIIAACHLLFAIVFIYCLYCFVCFDVIFLLLLQRFILFCKCRYCCCCCRYRFSCLFLLYFFSFQFYFFFIFSNFFFYSYFFIRSLLLFHISFFASFFYSIFYLFYLF